MKDRLFLAKAYCHRCEKEFSVEVTHAEYESGIVYDECQCGKSGAFGLVDEALNEANNPQKS